MGAIAIEDKAEYLGVVLGPDGGTSSWASPFKKFQERVAVWGTKGLGLLNTMEAYRVYIISVLLFIGQLNVLPPDFDKLEAKATRSLFPGSPGWITPEALKSLKSAGFPKELIDARCLTVAAQARVYLLENRREGGLNVGSRLRALQATMSSPDNMFRVYRLRDWLNNAIVHTLSNSFDQVKNAERLSGTSTSLCTVDIQDPSAIKGWQSRAYTLLRTRMSGDLHTHARARLDLWDVPVLPGHRVERWLRYMEDTRRRLPPRVQACQIRTALKGWTNSRRKHGQGLCVLGCPEAEDSLEHYAYCGHFRELCHKHLRLSPPAGDPVSTLVGLNRSCEETSEQRALRAIALYALYRAHNGLRHGGFGQTHVHDVFAGFLREAVQGHQPSTSLVASAKKRRA